MFPYPFTSEIGAGEIPWDVQKAIWREIHYRLGYREEPGPLSRLEKSLILIRIQACILNDMRTHLYALEALKAGGTLDQVAEAAISVTMVGMLRWKMAAMDALNCAEDWAAEQNLPPRTPPVREENIERKNEQSRDYIRNALSREFPDMWQHQAEVAPIVLDGYMRMRQGIVRSGGGFPSTSRNC